MSFSFRRKQEKISDKQQINNFKLNFFTQTFDNVNIFDLEKQISSVKKDAIKSSSNKLSLFAPLEESIISCKIIPKQVSNYSTRVCKSH